MARLNSQACQQLAWRAAVQRTRYGESAASFVGSTLRKYIRTGDGGSSAFACRWCGCTGPVRAHVTTARAECKFSAEFRIRCNIYTSCADSRSDSLSRRRDTGQPCWCLGSASATASEAAPMPACLSRTVDGWGAFTAESEAFKHRSSGCVAADARAAAAWPKTGAAQLHSALVLQPLALCLQPLALQHRPRAAEHPSPVLHVATSVHAAPPRHAKEHRVTGVTVQRDDGGNGGVALQAAGSARRPLLEGGGQALDHGSWRVSLAARASGAPEAPPHPVNDGQCPGRHAAAPPACPQEPAMAEHDSGVRRRCKCWAWGTAVGWVDGGGRGGGFPCQIACRAGVMP